MTLNRMYHWAPRDISRMPPQFRLIPVATSTVVMIGNRKFAGKLARTCTSGWASLDTLGFSPIHTPIGTQITVATTTRTTTRPKVIRPSRSAWPTSPNPAVPAMNVIIR